MFYRMLSQIFIGQEEVSITKVVLNGLLQKVLLKKLKRKDITTESQVLILVLHLKAVTLVERRLYSQCLMAMVLQERSAITNLQV